MTELYKFAIVPFEDVVEHGVLQDGEDSDLLWSQANLIVTYFLLIYSDSSDVFAENAIDWTETEDTYCYSQSIVYGAKCLPLLFLVYQVFDCCRFSVC